MKDMKTKTIYKLIILSLTVIVVIWLYLRNTDTGLEFNNSSVTDESVVAPTF